MEASPDWSTGARVCALEQLAIYVDDQINAAAVEEFENATSETQDSGADLGEGSAYLDDTPILFTPQAVLCGLCKGMANLAYNGSIKADECVVTGYCEVEWAKSFPEQYENDVLTARTLICGAELSCNALIVMTDLNGGVEPVVENGRCNVAKAGHNWRKNALAAVKDATLFDPDAGIEKFDGEGSGREA